MEKDHSPANKLFERPQLVGPGKGEGFLLVAEQRFRHNIFFHVSEVDLDIRTSGI